MIKWQRAFPVTSRSFGSILCTGSALVTGQKKIFLSRTRSVMKMDVPRCRDLPHPQHPLDLPRRCLAKTGAFFKTFVRFGMIVHMYILPYIPKCTKKKPAKIRRLKRINKEQVILLGNKCSDGEKNHWNSDCWQYWVGLCSSSVLVFTRDLNTSQDKCEQNKCNTNHSHDTFNFFTFHQRHHLSCFFNIGLEKNQFGSYWLTNCMMDS